MMHDIIQQNFMSITIIVFLIVFILANNNFSKKTNRLFLASSLCVLVLILEEAWELTLAMDTVYTQFRVVLSAIGYTLRPMTAYFLVLIIFKGTKKWKGIISIPVVLNGLVAFSALFGKWAFWYTPSNEFVRGPLGIVPFLTAAFYIALMLWMTVQECRKGDLMEALTVALIVILTVTATIMESVFKFSAIQSAASGISIAFYYLFLHTNQNSRDTLTGALTRRRFYLDAEKYNASISGVISLDLNNLKELNDKHGHLAGDKALITMTEVIKRCIKKRASVYRTGGDEFMILCYKISEEEAVELIRRIKKAMEETPYRCAMGYAPYHPLLGLEMVCQKADKAMYSDKLIMKRENNTAL